MRIFRRILLAFLFTSATFTLGQSAPAPPASPKASEEPQAKAPEPTTYRLEYNLYQTENGKRVNTRTYRINTIPSDRSNTIIRAGSRVPVTPGDVTKYLDIGLDIQSKLRVSEGHLLLFFYVEMSDIAPDASGQGTTPVLRSHKAESNVVVTLGKPMLLASIDDPTSRRIYEVEVKVTQE